MIVIGGEGSLIGTVLGTLVWQLTPEALEAGAEMSGDISPGANDWITPVADPADARHLRLPDPPRDGLPADRPGGHLDAPEALLRPLAVHDMSTSAVDTPPTGERRPAGPHPLLAVDNVEVVYGVSLAVRGISFEVPENGAVALLGPNGAGKTSTIRAISGLLDMHHGSIRDGEIRARRHEPQGHATRQDRRARGVAPGAGGPSRLQGAHRRGEPPRRRLRPASAGRVDTLTRSSTSSRASRSGSSSRPAGSRAASSRWSRSGGR